MKWHKEPWPEDGISGGGASAPPLPGVIRVPLRSLLRWWSYLPRAQGYLYEIVENWGERLSIAPLKASLSNGASVRCDLSDRMQRQIYFFGAYEPIESYLFSLLIQPGMVVIDAGANIGQYSLLAGPVVGPEGAVHAFEPVQRNFDRLRSNVFANELEGIVHVNRLALWHRAESLHFTLGADHALNCGAYTAGKTSDPVDHSSCDAVTLDQYVNGASINRLDVIKMDIEGAELFALQGARATLERWHPTILMELSRPNCRAFEYRPEQIWGFLNGLGYQMWDIGHTYQTSGPLSSPPPRDWSNVIFHTGPLPATVTREWTLRAIRLAQAMRGERRVLLALLARLLTPPSERGALAYGDSALT